MVKHLLVSAVASLALVACAAPEASTSASAAPMPSELVGDAARGLAYARAACAACHAVEAGEMRSPAPGAPPFEELAHTPGMNGRALTAWLYSSHVTMPQFIVEPEAIDDLAAYLAALESTGDVSAR